MTKNVESEARPNGVTVTRVKARPDGEEIELTPEMIEAGASVLCGFSTYFSDEAHWAKEVYKAMVKAALHEGWGFVVDRRIRIESVI